MLTKVRKWEPTGFSKDYLPAERTFPICKIEIEDEYHSLNICPAYQKKDVRY